MKYLLVWESEEYDGPCCSVLCPEDDNKDKM